MLSKITGGDSVDLLLVNLQTGFVESFGAMLVLIQSYWLPLFASFLIFSSSISASMEKNSVTYAFSPSEKVTFTSEEHEKIWPLLKMSGANFIRMILWPNSKRSIQLSVRKEISKVAQSNGAKTVEMFVNNDADITLRATDTSFSDLPKEKQRVYVLNANANGDLLNQISGKDCSMVGRGNGFNWAQFKLPLIRSKHGWLLVGRINPNNVCEAPSTLKPHGVDVSSDICGSDGIKRPFMNIFLHECSLFFALLIGHK
ncbi:hypothetical protein P3X46_002436 [Hevea brasiliensis]|uniref:phosphoribosylanthranilate isomerase n=1 Tax=Hevea brasiliensis TaxID=3981 RepID=A0ABQ9N2Z1_HEVBR|nr:hypothetical protein P3X46_002436 [Hevea brasiliensis]